MRIHSISGHIYSLLRIIFVLMLPLSISADNLNTKNEKALVDLLRTGGFNLYFRHESTDWSQDDYVEKHGDWLSCDGNKIRQLSSSGRKSATATGKAIRKLNIPVANIFSSPYCRTVETAELMNLGQVTATTEVMNLRVAGYFGGRSAIVKTAQQLLSKLPLSGTNTVIVAHGNVARAATPVYPDEGEMIIFKPNGNTFTFIDRVKPSDWDRLIDISR